MQYAQALLVGGGRSGQSDPREEGVEHVAEVAYLRASRSASESFTVEPVRSTTAA